jgi:tryptophan-rich sensory protein
MKYVQRLLILLLPFAAGAIGSLATTPNIPTWYADLEKPFLNPPNGVFGPVWTVLYLLIGIASLLVLQTKAPAAQKKAAYQSLSVQLFLNTAWSIVFFGLHQPWLGVITILLLLGSIIWNISAFHRVNKLAGLLLLPYFAWVCFAAYLTLGIAVLN